MSGFLGRENGNTIFNAIRDSVKNISGFGMNYDDMLVKNSQAIGVTEAKYGNQAMSDESLLYTLSLADTNVKKFIAHFDKEYKARREFLNKFAMNSEIEFILDTIADEAIIQDEKNFFCYPSPINSGDDTYDEKTLETYDDNFKKIYACFGFNDDITAWQYFRQLLIDGFLAFEIIYNEEGTSIIGFKELDAASLRPAAEKQEDGQYQTVWYQYENDLQKKRTLYDSQLIYISYAKGNSVSRVSYLERLIRSFNLLRIMEHTKIIWYVMNSSFRLKMVVPIGSKSPQKARESLGELMSIYKEDVKLDYDSGEISVNGRPNLQFFKNYMFPSKNGEQVDISSIGGEGPDMSDPASLDYFKNKLKLDSKIPISRFDNSGSGFGMDSNGTDREEIRFSKFINRLRSIFQEILTKPIYIQTTLDIEALKDDPLFKSHVGIRYNKDNLFEEVKLQEIMTKRVDFITKLMELKVEDDTSYFDPEWLIEYYLKLTKDEIDANDQKKKDRKAKADGSDSEENPDDEAATDDESKEEDTGFKL